MYNKQVIDRLIKLIQTNNGINDKNRLADIVQKEFSLKKIHSNSIPDTLFNCGRSM